MLESMTADEFVAWQAFERQNPFGFAWDNFRLARVLQFIESTIPRDKKVKRPKFDDLKWVAPEPLFVESMKKSARKRRKEPR